MMTFFFALELVYKNMLLTMYSNKLARKKGHCQFSFQNRTTFVVGSEYIYTHKNNYLKVYIFR